MTGPSMTLADRLQVATEGMLDDRGQWTSDDFVIRMEFATGDSMTIADIYDPTDAAAIVWLRNHVAEIVAALRDRDRLREAADALLAGYDAFVRAFDAGLGPSHPADYMGQDADDLRPLLSQPSPSSEEAPNG